LLNTTNKNTTVSILPKILKVNNALAVNAGARHRTPCGNPAQMAAWALGWLVGRVRRSLIANFFCKVDT